MDSADSPRSILRLHVILRGQAVGRKRRDMHATMRMVGRFTTAMKATHDDALLQPAFCSNANFRPCSTSAMVARNVMRGRIRRVRGAINVHPKRAELLHSASCDMLSV